ncbi:amino acid--tRNA ligase-related protein [Streptomyces sp. NPDC052107]|uniref:amino acid--tRNA ligase-related protein n=1 Tax=Streptomyces sp. NPDC052107 TaxID=3155632 RepID=UPI003432E16D
MPAARSSPPGPGPTKIIWPPPSPPSTTASARCLEHHRRVFEIGPCFRPEKPDELHAPEFQMLDLYAADEEFDFLMALAEKLIGPHIPYTPQRVSVADHIRDHFGIDLRREPHGDLPAQTAAHLGMGGDVPFKTVLGQFVERQSLGIA